MRKLILASALLCAVLTAAAQPSDSAQVAAVAKILAAQRDVSKLPQFKKEWNSFNYTFNPYAENARYRKLGFMPQKSSLEVKDSPLGIGFETLDRDTFDPKLTFGYLGESGVKYARCQTGWWKCERVKGKYDFAWLDEVVDSLAARGIETWFSVSFGHPDYTPCDFYEKQWEKARRDGTVVPGKGRGWVSQAPYYYGEAAMKGWCDYVKALARHFKGRVHVWEIWNEPEGFWQENHVVAEKKYGAVQAAKDFADFVHITSGVIKKVIPDARVAFNLARTSSVWVPTLAKAGIAEDVDIFCYHNYSRMPELGLEPAVEQARALFVRKDGTPLTIWQGESGRASGPSHLYAFPSEYNQAKFIGRRIFFDLSCGAEMTSLFTVIDFQSYYPDGADQYYGVWNARENRAKLGYYTLQNLAWIMDGIEPAPENFAQFTTPGSSSTFTSLIPFNNVKVVSMKRGGVPVIAFWQMEHMDITAEPLRGTLKAVTDLPSPFTHPILIDPIRGTVMDITNACPNLGTGEEKFAVWAYDYPLILTDLSIFNELL